MALLLALTAAAPPVGADADAPEPASEEVPRELTADLVYAVVAAEIALQREVYDAAFEHYLAAARLAQDPSLAESAARAALTGDDPAAAQQAVALWLELEPDAVKPRQLDAFVALEQGDTERALTALARVVELAPSPGQGYLEAAQLLGRLPDPQQRLSLMRRLVPDGDSADAQFALATLAAAADDDEAALAYAKEAAALRPGWRQPQLFVVRQLLSNDRPAAARAAIERFLERSPQDADLKLLKAQLLIDADQPEQAMGVFDEVLAERPQQPEVLFAAAVLALQSDRLEAARDYLATLRETGRRNSDAAFLLGQVEERAGNAEAALEWYRKVRGSGSTDALVRVAAIHAEQGRVARSREILQRLRGQQPEDAKTLFLIEAELLRKRGHEEQALAVYDRALAEHPDDPDLLYARAMLAASMDELGVLERDLRRILIIDPDHADALNALGYTLADRTDRLEEAERFIERALELRPDEPAILDSMGWLLYRQGDPVAAEPYLRRALADSFDAEIAAHLGEVLWQQGRREEARAVWGRALDEAPEHEYLLRVLSRFRFSRTGD